VSAEDSRLGSAAVKQQWQTHRLASVARKITDGSHNPPRGVGESQYLMLSSKNVFNDLLTYDAPRYLTAEQFHREDKRTEVAAGDVLLTIVGTIGRCAVVPIDAPNIALQRSVAVIKPHLELIDPRFLMHALIVRASELDNMAHGIAQKGLYLDVLRGLEVSLPSLAEQRRIAGLLDAACRLQRLTTEASALLGECVETLRSRLIAEAASR
jgi:type I restriction enzyme, S subunit